MLHSKHISDKKSCLVEKCMIEMFIWKEKPALGIFIGKYIGRSMQQKGDGGKWQKKKDPQEEIWMLHCDSRTQTIPMCKSTVYSTLGYFLFYSSMSYFN